jgi:hypothetical protein
VTNIKAQDKILAQLAFVTDPVDIFAQGAFPMTTVTPDTIYWGDKASVSVDVSTFTVEKATNMTYVGVYIYPSSTVTAITDVKISPAEGKSDPPLYQSIWEYPNMKVMSYGAHQANYTLTIPSTPVSQDIVLATWVEVRYSTPLRMKEMGSIEGADGSFFTWDSSISYEHEKGILEAQLGV